MFVDRPDFAVRAQFPDATRCHWLEPLIGLGAANVGKQTLKHWRIAYGPVRKFLIGCIIGTFSAIGPAAW
jgi:hypothetical protein